MYLKNAQETDNRAENKVAKGQGWEKNYPGSCTFWIFYYVHVLSTPKTFLFNSNHCMLFLYIDIYTH